MTAEEAMDRIGNVLEALYAGTITHPNAINEVARIRGAYLIGKAGQ
ncbi:hypothetical protein [Pseudarthrobacter sp. MEB009]|nr:hypothetical protein [Pseudarthrobacter sp. MEB009]